MISNAFYGQCSVALSHVWLFVTPWTGSSVHGITQARISEWVIISSSRGSSRPKNRTHVSRGSCIGRRILYHRATWEALLTVDTSLHTVLIPQRQLQRAQHKLVLTSPFWFWGGICTWSLSTLYTTRWSPLFSTHTMVPLVSGEINYPQLLQKEKGIKARIYPGASGEQWVIKDENWGPEQIYTVSLCPRPLLRLLGPRAEFNLQASGPRMEASWGLPNGGNLAAIWEKSILCWEGQSCV